jgi:hypothetical protein
MALSIQSSHIVPVPLQEGAVQEKAVGVSARPSSSGPVDNNTKGANATIADVPDGGLEAWLQVLGAFFLWWNTWGEYSIFVPATS